MKNLFKFEMHCLLRQISFYVCTIIAVLVVAAPIAVMSTLRSNNVQGDAINYFNSAFSGSGMDLLIPILISIIVTRDFSNDSMGLIAGRGYSRISIYCSKIISSFIVICIMAIASWISAWISIFMFMNIKITIDFETIKIMISQIIVAFAIGMVALTVTFYTRKTSAAISAGFLLPLIGTIVITLIEHLAKIDNKLNRFWIWSCFAKLTGETINVSTVYNAILTSIIWLILFSVTGFLKFSKSDL